MKRGKEKRRKIILKKGKGLKNASFCAINSKKKFTGGSSGLQSNKEMDTGSEEHIYLDLVIWIFTISLSVSCNLKQDYINSYIHRVI